MFKKKKHLKKCFLLTGQMVYSVRMQCGRMLARESVMDADIVSSVPESGTAAAHGFAREVSSDIIIYCTKLSEYLNTSNFSFFLLIFSQGYSLRKYYAKTVMLDVPLSSQTPDCDSLVWPRSLVPFQKM